MLTGAGISVPSGIPDFRTPMTGLWANVDPMEVAHIDVWRRDPERFWSFYGQRFAILDGKEPNGAHRAIAELERRGLVSGVVTQNIDGLHALAGTRPDRGPRVDPTASCLACGASLLAGGDAAAREASTACRCATAARCSSPTSCCSASCCPSGAMLRATALAMSAGLMLAIGSSLEVWPVAGLPEDTLRAGGKLAIVTMGADALRPRSPRSSSPATWSTSWKRSRVL